MKYRLAIVALAVCVAQSLPVMSQTTAAAPKITQELQEMENKFFEHDFSKESLDYRVQRLEKFAFGEASTGPLDQRIERLAKVVELHKPLVAPKVPTGDQSQSDPDTADSEEVTDQSKYPHITFLEQQILKKTFETDSLEQRLSRLEVKAFGKATNSPDPAARTDALQAFVDRTTPRSAAPQVANAGSQYRSGSAGSQFASSDSSDPQSESYANYKPKRRIIEPMQVIAGLAGMAGGLAGVPIMVHQAPQPSPDTDEDAQNFWGAAQIDPAVLQDTPPDVHARMLTRVGWCEQHLFGHTFPHLHLTQRLHQLNTELFPQSHKSDIQLMDCLDVIVKEVVMRQHPPIATAQNPATTQQWR